MPAGRKTKRPQTTRRGRTRSDTARLDELIAEATADCNNEEEQLTGIFTMLEEGLELPFTTVVLGMEVAVTAIDLNDGNELVAVCGRGRNRQRIPILDLPLPKPAPKGAEWIEVYRRWASWR